METMVFGPASRSKLVLSESGDAIHLFGETYRLSAGAKSRKPGSRVDEVERFTRHFRSIVWMTYRRDFFPMPPSDQYTSDAGWGCMLRSAQMILCQALERHLHGDQWRLGQRCSLGHRELLRCFSDVPRQDAVYSIHRLVQCGARFGKQPGQWYGPWEASFVLRDLVDAHRGRHIGEGGTDADSDRRRDDRFAMMVPDDGNVYIEEAHTLCGGVSESEVAADAASASAACDDPLLRPCSKPTWVRSLFILVPRTLLAASGRCLNAAYIPSLLEVLRFPQSVGMIGGKPSHSLYFVGSQGRRLVYLDPHTVQPAVVGAGGQGSSGLPTDEEVSTYHSNLPKGMPIEQVDPSVALGFYCRNADEFDDLCHRIRSLQAAGMHAPFYVERRRPPEPGFGCCDEDDDHTEDDGVADRDTSAVLDDDFVFVDA